MPELSWNEMREAALNRLGDEMQRSAKIAEQSPEPTPPPAPLIVVMRKMKYRCRKCGRRKLKADRYCSTCKASMKAARHEKGKSNRKKKTDINTSSYYGQHPGLMP